MATYQVRIDADGEKVLSEPLSGMGGGIATEDAPGIVRPDGVTTRVDNTGVLSALGGNLQFNDEIWITESGDWEVPYDGLYEVFVIDGGASGSVASLTAGSAAWANGGQSGAFDTTFLYLTAGTVIPVTIGAGAAPLSTADGGWSAVVGGITSFGTFTPIKANKRFFATSSPNFHSSMKSSIVSLHAEGGGIGTHSSWVAQEKNNAHYYGAGGSAIWMSNNIFAGTGYQGVVRLRFWNPDKAAGPTE